MSADATSISRRRGVRLVAERWINLCAALVALLLSQGEFVPVSHAITTLVTASTYNYDRTDASAQRASMSVAFASVRTIRLAPASTAHGAVSPRFAHFLAAKAGASALEDASAAAFKAADNVDAFTVPAKHLPGAGGKWGKFVSGVDPKSAIQEALRSEGAMFRPIPGRAIASE